ncbi:hypothetical protein PoB_004292400 [Plakobranchus ocellatus]|uniref:Uncharacterized protein n=1 Tax=Plakobranchus ocellatus TaxID=259542 RepID=A0AAV4BCC4_9GAST|nr:hypothetical protein PoB_004292400 [Plakobranchus ocellatus]
MLPWKWRYTIRSGDVARCQDERYSLHLAQQRFHGLGRFQALRQYITDQAIETVSALPALTAERMKRRMQIA